MNYEMSRSLSKINNYTMGEKIKYLRKMAGLSLDNLADEIDVAKGTLSQIENGKSCNLSTIIDIANRFDVSIDWLCSRSTISDTDYNLNFVCDYLGLSESAVTEFKSELNDTKRYDQEYEEIIRIINTMLSDNLLQRLSIQALLYKQAKEEEEKYLRDFPKYMDGKLSKSERIKIKNIIEEDNRAGLGEHYLEKLEKEKGFRLFMAQRVVNSFIDNYTNTKD